jgi:hypothetical protein
MPIRINLLAEQQAAEEARRKDPVKRALIIGGALVVLILVWTLSTFMQVKARRAELANLDTAFKQLDERARGVRTVQSEVGDFERRIASLDRYSTNRILWASMLDALQKPNFSQIRMKSIVANEKYITNAATVFFSTNFNLPFATKAPAWKFWASGAAATSPTDQAAKLFKSFTNAPPFSTNKLAYSVKTSIVSTNLAGGEVQVKCDFTLPAVDIEDIELLLSAGDYGNPPGAAIDEYARSVVNLPYFTERLASGDERLRFVDRPPNAEPDLALPNNPMYKRFTMRLQYAHRVLTNE